MGVGVRLLGGFAVSVDGTAVEPDTWPSRRAAHLVALLALSPRRRLPSDQVMDALWPDLDADAARANLHKAATYARRALGWREAVVLRAGTVTLAPDADVRVDAAEFEAAGRAALDGGDPSACAAAAGLYAGDLLPDDLYEDWTAAPRERLQRMHRDLLRRAGRWSDLVDLDPLDEEAHRELMAEHHRAGRLHAAIRQFQRLRTILGRELGVAPAPETLAVYRSIVGTSRPGWIRPALVGREVELVRARAALRRTAERRSAALLVTGPAGIGKTRFCEELVDQAGAEGWFVLRGTATEESAAVPYRAVLDALEAAVVHGPGIADALDPADRELLVRLTADAPGNEPLYRHAVMRLVARVLRAAGAERGVLVLDDLHVADEATWEVATVLASAPPPRGLLVVATYRPDRLAPAMADAVRSLVTSGTGIEIALAPLSRAETDLIVADIAGRPVSADEADAAWHLSEGNAFFAVEVAASLGGDAAVGTGTAGVLATRLARVAADTRRALRAVGLVTDEFDADVVAAIAGLAPQAALDVVRDATAAGIVAAHDGGYRFRHDLVRGTLTGDATDAERAEAHAAFAAWLAETRAAAGRVAHHLVAAGRRDEALPYLRAAAEHALAVGAHHDAVSLADAGLGIAPADPGFLGLRADGLFGAGDPAAAAAYGVAIAASGGPARTALGIRRARALILTGDIPAALESLDGVRADVLPGDVQYLVARGIALWCAGGLDEASALGDEARRLAEAAGDLRGFVDATMLQAMVAHDRGAWPQRAALDLLDEHIRPDLATVVIDAHLCVAESYLYGGVDYADVIRFATDLRARGAQAGAGHAEAFAATLLGEAHLLTGEVAVAMDVLTTAAAMHERVGVLCGEALSLQRLAEAHLATGDRPRAQALLGEALVAARGSPVATRHLLDRIHGTAIRAADDLPAALAAVDEAVRAVQGPFEACPPCSVNRTIPSAVACAEAGALDRARLFLAAAEQVVAAFYPRGGWPAALDEARSHVARAEGDPAAADRLLRQALDGFEREGQALDAERCRALLSVGKV